MEEAFHFICKHYDLSEETVRKLLEQEGMLREVAEHGRLLSSAERKATKKKKKKAAPVARETDAGKVQCPHRNPWPPLPLRCCPACTGLWPGWSEVNATHTLFAGLGKETQEEEEEAAPEAPRARTGIAGG